MWHVVIQFKSHYSDVVLMVELDDLKSLFQP